MWYLVVAHGDDVSARIVMGEILDSFFPFNSAFSLGNFSLDSVEMTAEQHLQSVPTLLESQKGLIKDLYKICASTVVHFQQMHSSLPRTVSLEEIACIGNDKINISLGKTIRSKLCGALASILSDGFDSFTLFGKHFIWDYIKAASTERHGSYATSATSQEELSMASTIAKIETTTQLHGNPSIMLRTFLCLALSEGSLEQWLKLIASSESQMERFYYIAATWRTAHKECIEPLKMLRGLPFKLDILFEVKKEK